jgi:glycosyltransferase involved in cell wall biosynthesis
MRVGMLSSDWGDFSESSPGGCTHMRMFIPAKAMTDQGIEVIIGEFGWKDDEGFVAVPTILRAYQGNRGLIINPKEYAGDLNVIIMKLWMWHEYEEYITRAKEMGQTVIADLDDWFDGLPTTNIAFETTHPKADALWNRNHMISSYRHMNGLITSTKFLNDYYKSSNQNVIQVDNSLDPSAFIRRVDVAGNKPVVGWAGMMLWRQHDIQQLQGWLGDFLEKYDLNFYQAGVSYDNPKQLAEVAKINPDRFFGVPGCSAKNYGNILLPIDIGIVPLEKVSFNEAKSSLKGMEYAMTGIPFVATDTEEYKRLNSDGAGSLARRNRDWSRELEKLLDPNVRKEQAERGYKTVMEKYNINVVVNKWIDTIEYIRSTNPKAR